MLRYIRGIATVPFVFLVLLAIPVFGKGAGGRTASSHSPRISSPRSNTPRSSRCTSCAHDTHGRIHRSPVAKHKFEQTHPCPSTGKTSGACPGYVIDHKQPLKRGGPDDPSNMQWQTKEEAKAKDGVE